MIARVVARVILLMAGLALATALIVGAMARLASIDPYDPSPPFMPDYVAAVKQFVEVPAPPPDDATPTRAIVLVLAGIVMLAAQPPVQRIHVYHRSYQRPDWF
jgi:hypothetical protein